MLHQTTAGPSGIYKLITLSGGFFCTFEVQREGQYLTTISG